MRPATEADLAEVVRGARTGGGLAIRGGGTRGIGRAVTGDALETAGLNGISLYEPGALTIVAGAGTLLTEVEAALAAEGQRLAFEVPDMRGLLGRAGQSTIGGVVAVNASGPRRVQVGACRDSLIGVRFVDGRGEIIKNGGRVMKNVTGYDLVKLMAGSHGTLGVLTEVAFKVLPVPEAQVTLLLHGLDDRRAVSVMAAALGSPYDVTGAAHWPGVGTFVRIEGFAPSVAYRADRLAGVLAEFGVVERAIDPWADIRDVAAFRGLAGDVWRLSVKPSDGPGIVARIGADAVLYDWGGGLIWVLVPAGHDLRARVAGLSGHATLIRADAATRAMYATFQPEPVALAAIAAGLRARFDPRGILNPGVM
ncbi:MAG: FAD-binding protein [Paracoccaceae bacterium]|nr:FAD-binding protein [Paracoccaceae bacterium]